MYGYGIATLMSPPTIVLSLLPLFYPFYHRLSLPSLFCHLPSSICPCHHRLIPQIIESSPPIIFSIPQIMVLSLLSSIHPLPFVSLNLIIVFPSHNLFISHHCFNPFSHRLISHFIPPIIVLSSFIVVLSLRRFISLISRNSPSLVPCRRYTYSKPSSPYIPCPAPRPHHCVGLRSPCPAMSRSSPQLESASLDARPSRASAHPLPHPHTHTTAGPGSRTLPADQLAQSLLAAPHPRLRLRSRRRRAQIAGLRGAAPRAAKVGRVVAQGGASCLDP